MHPSESEPEVEADLAATDTGDDEAVRADETAVPTPARWRRPLPVRVPVVAIAAVIGVIAVTATALLGWRVHDDRQTGHLRDEAVTTARDYLVAMAGFDYEQLDANTDIIGANSTPEFAGQYTEMVSALRDIVVASKGQATATADRIAVEHLDRHTATVIAFVDQQVTNATVPQGNTQRYRMVVDLLRDGDRWVVDNVETL